MKTSILLNGSGITHAPAQFKSNIMRSNTEETH
jgi:hypothetical protein